MVIHINLCLWQWINGSSLSEKGQNFCQWEFQCLAWNIWPATVTQTCVRSRLWGEEGFQLCRAVPDWQGKCWGWSELLHRFLYRCSEKTLKIDTQEIWLGSGVPDVPPRHLDSVRYRYQASFNSFYSQRGFHSTEMAKGTRATLSSRSFSEPGYRGIVSTASEHHVYISCRSLHGIFVPAKSSRPRWCEGGF